jgi:hypothetical protein
MFSLGLVSATAIAARSPEHLVDENLPVVAHDLPAHAPVVVLMPDAAAPALVVELLGHQDIVVLVFESFAVDDLSARRLLTGEVAAGHVCPSLRSSSLRHSGAARLGGRPTLDHAAHPPVILAAGWHSLTRAMAVAVIICARLIQLL